MSIVPFYWGGSNLNYQRGLLSLFSLCSEVRITPHHENGLLHLHLGWCSIFPSETAETLAAARVSGVASFSATLVGAEGGIRTLARFNPSTPLAGEPLIATWVLLQLSIAPRQERGGGESGIRTHGSCESPVFKTGSLNHSDISPCLSSIRGE